MRATQVACPLALLLLAACGAFPRLAEPTSAPHLVKMREGGLDAALSEARRKGVPLVVDVWASWCMPCLAERASLFPDPALGAVADRYEWVAIDRDGPEGGAVRARFHVVPLPTLLVLDSATETPMLRIVGGLSAVELVDLLQLAGPAAAPATPFARAVRVEAAGGDGAEARAAPLFAEALRESSAGWPLRAFAVDRVLAAHDRVGSAAACADLVASESAKLPASEEHASVLAHGIRCAAAANRQDAAHRFAEELRELLDDEEVPMLPCDRANLYGAVVDAARTGGDLKEVESRRTEWRALVERLRAHARSDAERASLDGPRKRAESAASAD